jgi:hypothetical protein
MVQLKRFPSVSLIGMLQVRLNKFPVEPSAGDGIPYAGGLFPAVVKIYDLLVHRPLPAGVGSVVFTQTL